MSPTLPECSEVAGADAAPSTGDDGAATSKRPQQQAPTRAGGGASPSLAAKPWAIAYDGSAPPSSNALAALKSRYPLDPPGYDTAIAKEPVR